MNEKSYKDLISYDLVSRLQKCITAANCHDLNGLIHSYYSVATAKFYGKCSEKDIICIEEEIEDKIKKFKSK